MKAAPTPPSEPTGLTRVDSSLEAVVQAIRAGHATVKAIGENLGLSYATANRRINALLRERRIGQTAPPHSRSRTFFVRDDPGRRIAVRNFD